MEFSGCINDESLGPAVEGCRGDFDFTIKFEKIFFMQIPTTLFIAICLPRLFYLTRQPVIVDGGGRLLQAAKLVRPVLSICLSQVAGLILDT
jgi:ATP-binding cassette subfamily C (CFTR/MRP) protein 1